MAIARHSEYWGVEGLHILKDCVCNVQRIKTIFHSSSHRFQLGMSNLKVFRRLFFPHVWGQEIAHHSMWYLSNTAVGSERLVLHSDAVKPPTLFNPAHLSATGATSRPDSDVSPPLEPALIISATPHPDVSGLFTHPQWSRQPFLALVTIWSAPAQRSEMFSIWNWRQMFI